MGKVEVQRIVTVWGDSRWRDGTLSDQIPVALCVDVWEEQYITAEESGASYLFGPRIGYGVPRIHTALSMVSPDSAKEFMRLIRASPDGN
jgi:hypothetical protein